MFEQIIKGIYFINSILAFIWLGHTVAYSQNSKLIFENYTVSQGLSQSHVTSIVQDQIGFLWIGTHNGLNKFDGYNFENYLYNPEKNTSISSNKIIKLYTGAGNYLWVVSSKGIDKFDIETESFYNHSYDIIINDNENIVKVNCFITDHEGNAWFGTNKGLLCYSPVSNLFVLYQKTPENGFSISENDVLALFEDSQKRLWIGTQNGLNLYSDKKFFRLYNTEEENSLANSRIGSIAEDAQGHLWFGGWGLSKMLTLNLDGDKIAATFQRFSNPDLWIDPKRKSVTVLHTDSHGFLWVGTDQGVVRLNTQFESDVKHFFHEPQYRSALDENRIMQILEDNEGNLWFRSSGEKGLFYINGTSLDQKNIRHFSNQPGSLGNNAVNYLFSGNGNNLWIGTLNGLSKLNLSEKKFNTIIDQIRKTENIESSTVFSIGEDINNLWIGTTAGLQKLNKDGSSNTSYRNIHGRNQNLPFPNVSLIEQDPSGFLWIGYLGFQLSWFYPGSEKFSHFEFDPNDPECLKAWSARDIVIDDEKTVWLGFASGGLVKYDRITKKFSYLTPGGDGSYNPLSFGIHALHYSGFDNNIWIGTRDRGLLSYNPKSKEWNNYGYNLNDKLSIYGNEVWYIHQSKSNPSILWLGTNMGLNAFDTKKKTVEFYSIKDGLPNNIVNGILEDKHGYLWLSTDNGLCRFDPKLKSVTLFDKDDGLLCQEFIAGSCLETSDGRFMFGCKKGLVIFHPDSIQAQLYFPKVVLNRLKLFNREISVGDTLNGNIILNKSISYTEILTLNYRENDFSIGFTSLGYNLSNKIFYSYMMEGYDESWKFTDSDNREATYTNLQSGNYTFIVRATTDPSKWPLDGTQIKVAVTPPFWKTIWFRAALIMILLGGVIIFVRIRTYFLENQRRLLTQKVKEMTIELEQQHLVRYRFFTNISHELRTPLTLILNPAEKLHEDASISDSGRNYATLIHRNANRLLKLINQLLDFRKLESGQMKLKVGYGDISFFVKQVFDSFENMAQKRGIEYFMSGSLTSETVNGYFDKDNLEKVLFNLLSNAFKFTFDGGRIIFETDYDVSKQLVSVSIVDNGVGIPENELERVFERFYRIESGVAGQKAGTGIGLAFSKELVELHRGTIKVSSIKGKGTRFSISISSGKDTYLSHELVEASENTPISLVNRETYKYEDQDLPDVSSTELPATDHDITILVIDDNPDICDLIRNDLSSDYKIIVSNNGKSGLDVALQIIPQLIISDVMMPEMNGIEFCKAIKANWLTAHIPVIMITALSSVEHQLEGLVSGADDYITKPFQSNILRVKIANQLNHFSQLKKWLQSDMAVNKANSKFLSGDDKFMNKINAIIDLHLSDTDFDLEALSAEMGYSRMHVHRKIKSLFGVSSGEFLRTMRLKQAAKLIKTETVTVSEVAYTCGFNDPSYFSKAFKKQFGISPSDYC